MCGRVYIKATLDEMLSAFNFASGAEALKGMANDFPRFNGAPRTDYPIIIWDAVRDGGMMGPCFVRANWGLVPPWAKPGGPPPPINARGETIATNGMFRAAYRDRRALLPIAGGYFEWQDVFGTGKDKRPYAICMADDSPFCMAAIWERSRDPVTGGEMKTFAIVTCEPNAMMQEIHDRMPVILHRDDYERWLTDPDPRDLIRPYPSKDMKMWKIGRKVGSPSYRAADILDPIISEDDDPVAPKARKPPAPKKPNPPEEPPPQGDLF